MSDQHAVENMKRYPDQIQPFIQAEIKLAHTWKKGKSLEQLWDQCQDIDDVEAGQSGGSLAQQEGEDDGTQRET